MIGDDPDERNSGAAPAAASRAAIANDPDAWTQAEVTRLLLAPAIAAMLYVGGVYWLRSQISAEPSGRERSAMVQVQLLPRPAPASIPIASTPQPSAGNMTSRADVPVNDPDQSTVDIAALPPSQPSVPSELISPGVRSVPSPMEAPASGVTAQFQQALFRHVARFQRYPRAARRDRLHGAVDTLFSMRRDGSLIGVWVKISSGQAVLDKEALDTIRRAQPLPAIPPELPDLINLRITLTFEPP